MGTRETLVLQLLSFLSLAHGSLIVYPAASAAPKSDKFKVFLSQNGNRHESHVYITSSDHRLHHDGGAQAGRSMSWTSFAFSGAAVTVEIHTPKDFHNCLVRPKRYGIKCIRTGVKTAHVTVRSAPRQMSVEFDYDYGNLYNEIKDKMMVFADPPETNVPGKHAPHVMYYDVGVHNLHKTIPIPVDVTEVYIAPGAFIRGGFYTTNDHHGVKIHGRGVVDNRDFVRHDSAYGQSAIITLGHGNGNVVEGVTLSDPQKYFLINDVGRAKNGVVRNVKMVGGWVTTNDGLGAGQGGIVEDCFIHACDDAIKLYHGDAHISRVVIWQNFNGAVFQFGWFGHHLNSIVIDNIDIIHTDWCTNDGAGHCFLSNNNAVVNLAHLNPTASPEFVMSDIMFRNVNIETECVRLFNFEINDPMSGTFSNIRFVNWDVHSQPTGDKFHNVIKGSQHGRVANWCFENFKVGGHCLSDSNQGDFDIDPHTADLHFHCGGSIVG